MEITIISPLRFQHTAAEFGNVALVVLTHSRPKAAGGDILQCYKPCSRFQHTAARRRLDLQNPLQTAWRICFNTQQPEGGWKSTKKEIFSVLMFQHTAARRRLGLPSSLHPIPTVFQHTAARRRLGAIIAPKLKPPPVSTHSSPKAAGYSKKLTLSRKHGFQHTAARRRLAQQIGHHLEQSPVSTHSSPKAAGLGILFYL